MHFPIFYLLIVYLPNALQKLNNQINAIQPCIRYDHYYFLQKVEFRFVLFVLFTYFDFIIQVDYLYLIKYSIKSLVPFLM